MVCDGSNGRLEQVLDVTTSSKADLQGSTDFCPEATYVEGVSLGGVYIFRYYYLLHIRWWVYLRFGKNFLK